MNKVRRITLATLAGGLADEASRRLTRALAEAAEVLTPEQRKELAARFARRRWGHG